MSDEGPVLYKDGRFEINEKNANLRFVHSDGKAYEIFYAWDAAEGTQNQGKAFFQVDERFELPRPKKGPRK